MFRNPRVWLYAAGGWLVVTGAAHTAAHVWTFVLENGMVGLREFAMNAMQQAQSPDPLRPSLWRQFRMFSVSFGLLLFFSGAMSVLMASIDVRPATMRAFALFGTVFWTVAFVPYAFVDPVIQSIVVAAVAVPLHGLAYVTAAQIEEAGTGDAGPDPASSA